MYSRKCNHFLGGKHIASLVLCTLFLPSSAALRPEPSPMDVVIASYSCMNSSCNAGFSTCSTTDHADPQLPPHFTFDNSCSRALQCHMDCQGQSTKAARLACSDSCSDELETNSRVLYNELYTCFDTWCETEAAIERCNGWPDAASCEANQGCFFNIDTCSTHDETVPVFQNCPRAVNANSKESTADQVVRWSPLRATDQEVDVPVVQIGGTLDTGDTFPVGSTALEFSATDAAGNTAYCNFSVVVTDIWAPSITFCPRDRIINGTEQDFIVDATGRHVVNVSWLVPHATDNVAVSFSAASPATTHALLAVGEHPITYTAIDPSGNSAVCSFTVYITPAAVYQFDRLWWSIPNAFAEHDVSSPYSSSPILLMYFPSMSTADACARRCHTLADCRAFSVSRDGVGQCVLLSRAGTTAPLAVSETSSSHEWDTYTARGDAAAPPGESSRLFCPNQEAYDTCYQQNALSTSPASTATCPGVTAKAAYLSCIDAETSGLPACENEFVLLLHQARLEAFDCYCTGPADDSCEIPTSPPVQCDGTFSSFAECVRCCRANSTFDACRVPWRGVATEDGEANPTCVQNRYNERLNCSHQCRLARPFPAAAQAGISAQDVEISDLPPEGYMDVAIIVQLTAAATLQTARDDAMVATLLLALARVLALDVNAVQVLNATGSVASSGVTSMRFEFKARVGEVSGPADMTDTRLLASLVASSTHGPVTWSEYFRNPPTSSTMAMFSQHLLAQVLRDGERFVKASVSHVSIVELMIQPSAEFLAAMTTTPLPTTVDPNATTTAGLVAVTTASDPNGGLLAGAGADGTDEDNATLSSRLVAVIVITVLFIFLVVLVLYACYRKPRQQVAPSIASFHHPAPVQPLPASKPLPEFDASSGADRGMSMPARFALPPTEDPFADAKPVSQSTPERGAAMPRRVAPSTDLD
eukprot:m.1232338 g.1232338  ORF g.1232338 m.1232338 type:complete len:932 (+) comp24660_c0_seq15:177-2972(+)